MSAEHAFVQHIRQQPQDDAARLIYADFLDDSGDPRGELIRVQVELARTPIGGARRPLLLERQRTLLAQHGEQWLAPLRALGAQGVSVRCFQRGLIERVAVSASRFLDSGAELCRIAPALHCLELRDVADVLQSVAEFPMPPQITSLDLSSKGLQADEMHALCGAPWLDHIVQLHLRANRLGDLGIAALTAGIFVRLEILTLDVNGLGPDAAAALAAWPPLTNLKRLSLSVNALGNIGVQRLCNSEYLTGLQRLDLACNGIESEALRYLTEAAAFHSLVELNLRSNRIGADALQLFSRSTLAGRLKQIDVRGNSLQGIDALRSALPAGVVGPLT